MKTSVFSQVSIDGKLTLGPGQSSKPLFSLFDGGDMEYIHKFRGIVDGIMVGKNTITTDNPFLTNRYEENKNPVRIVPTRTMDIPLDSHVLADEGQTILVTTELGKDERKIELLRERGKECLICGEDKVDFAKLFSILEQNYGIHRLMVEGGGFLNWHVFNEDLVDEIILMQLPIIIGGASNITLVDGEGYTRLDFTKKFKVVEVQPKDHYTLLRYMKAV
ncbi:2,5-diamino-6-ribosylamino-4(3H)-pyrimidinone 5'-phosphate reductase [Paenibacillus faecis]|uniref:Riboflavin biosynthesis protein RibD n=1 Tax=Paenibacillus faecis TaxID=862114 RepID=A0A5D0CN75_9BACL|nr:MULTISPECIES: dihydrofolate reductase family protein [Paenibacillus]MCA1292419.1 dihydrofolate reductase family protein [Paenibacillus sp. alder61]TYA11489.1 riboflavin biosynthesis protein RibD [Paenibacillus faecis]GIO86848.1 2,5-diamino-6-ribosylamino-4(3H)-pyrimidinone 5'-phosphate reductase [Paenibacillus faecis]